MKLKGKQNILIKTYTHPSGLWYLGLSLYNQLTNDGHKVRFIPKAKFFKKEGRYSKKYPLGDASYAHLRYQFDERIDVGSQVSRAVRDYRATTIISMETLMESSSWIRNVKKRTGVRIIDVPMLEWVTPSILNRGDYNIFDEVWATTDVTMDALSNANVRGAKRVSWDYVDRNLFYRPSVPTKKFQFYHQGSLNPVYSSKNTEFVILAFNRLSADFKDISLVLTGVIDSPRVKKLVEKHTNISSISTGASRLDIAEIYRNSFCVVAPSSKEGLGLSFFEAGACGCELITTDAPPMNSHNTKYLCEVNSFRKDRSLVPIANLTIDSIYKQMKRVCEDKNVR